MTKTLEACSLGSEVYCNKLIGTFTGICLVNVFNSILIMTVEK